MLRILIMCLLVLRFFGGSAEAADWQWMGSTDRAGFYIDASSLKAEKIGYQRYVTAWFKCEYVPEVEDLKYTLKYLKFTVAENGEISCTQKQDIYYDLQHRTLSYEDSSFDPFSINELFFAAMTDYLLGAEENWLNRLNSGDRWVWVGKIVDNQESIWFDRYRSTQQSNEEFYMYEYHINKAGRRWMESNRINIVKRKIGLYAAVPDSIDDVMLESAEQMMKEPSAETIQWRTAMKKLRKVIEERAIR